MEKTNFNKIFIDLKRLNPFLHQRFPMSNWSKFFKDKKLLSVSTNENEINWLKIKEFGEKYILSLLNKINTALFFVSPPITYLEAITISGSFVSI